VVNNALVNAELAKYAGPGGWNDPDFLLGSSPLAAMHLTPLQSRMQFSLWAVMAAPLIISSNLLRMPPFDLETYTNEDVIAVDQDPLGVQGVVVWGSCPKVQPHQLVRGRGMLTRKPPPVATVPHCQQVWAKPLASGDHALLFVNFAPIAAHVVCDSACFAALGYVSGRRPARVLDLWQHRDLGHANETLEAVLAPDGGFAMFRLEEEQAGGGASHTAVKPRSAELVVI